MANLFAADTASLGENVILLAGPWPHVFDSVSSCLSAQPIEGAVVTDVVENIGHFQVGRAKGIAGVVGADSTACTGSGAYSPAGDSISSEEARNTCPAVLAAATSIGLRASQTQEAQAK